MSETERARPSRVQTHIEGLDAVLQGGLLQRCVYLLEGRPGAGKTILASQICFNQAARGGRALYVTLLSEAHERMLAQLAPLRFFDARLVPDRLAYVSGFGKLADARLPGLLELLRHEARAHRPAVIVLDGLVTVEEAAATPQELKRFIHELQALCSLTGATMLLLTSAATDPTGPVHAVVDGVIALSDRHVATRTLRQIEVTKFRGSDSLAGQHALQIEDAGVVVYPRLEALLRSPHADAPCTSQRLATGMPRLDAALQGGLILGSSTMIFGPTGSGKTTIGLQFLAQSSAAEPGLYFGFFEPPSRILFKGELLGLGLAEKREAGALALCWYPPTERVLDVLGHQLLAAVRERGVKRLVVDGIDGFIKVSADPDRITHFMSALTNELRVLGVTTVHTFELPAIFSREVPLPMRGLSSLLENTLVLGFLEHQAQLTRTLTIIKLRDSGYDGTIRELQIAPGATDVAHATPRIPPTHVEEVPRRVRLRKLTHWLRRSRRGR